MATFLAHHLPVVPPLNGFVLLGLILVGAYTVYRLHQADLPPYEGVDRLADPDIPHPSDPWLDTQPGRGPLSDLWASEEDWSVRNYPEDPVQL